MTDEPKPDSTPKYLAGCGGCCCLWAVLLLIAGVIMLILGNEPRTTELLPFGIGALVATAPAGLLAAVLLGLGLTRLSAQKKAAAGQPSGTGDAPPPPPPPPG